MTEEEHFEEISENIRRIREAKGMSQADLARATGMNPGTLHRIEKGHGNLRVSTIYRLAEALSVPPSFLFEAPNAEHLHLWELFSKLSDDTKSHVLGLLGNLSERETED